MSSQDPSSHGESIQRDLALEAICDEFESEYVAGRKPKIEDFLSRVEVPARKSLLVELVMLELHYRRLAGESIELAEYRNRFTELPPSLWEELQTMRPATGPSVRSTATVPNVSPTGMLIAGKYKLLQQIGEGGMGTVWMAEQKEPVNRRVALKLIRVDRVGSKTILSRFEAERQAIAMMEHPNISKLLDAGTTEDGAPFFVMELVKGIPLTDYCDRHKLSIAERLKLFTQICSAIQHAHQKGIIHRDLKPSNILVEQHDGRPLPKVIDFGLAKATSGLQLTENTLFTGFGSVIGTPLYMAPEQADLNAIDVDTRADIYSLGVILFELLTGTTPLSRDTIKRAALDVMLRLIREEEAPAPSSRLSSAEAMPSIAVNRQTEPNKLGRLVKGELDWIVMKSLSKDRDRRYETANGFAKDIERFLDHEPVLAGPPGTGYKLRKFIQRNKRTVVAGLLLLVTMVVGMIGTTIGLLESKKQQSIAETKQKAAETATVRAEEAMKRAILFRDTAAQTLIATLNEDVQMLIGSRQELGPNERAYLEAIAARWRSFVETLKKAGDDEHSRKIRSLGHSSLGFVWESLGQTDEALKEALASIETWKSLSDEFPNEIHYKTALWFAHHSTALVLNRIGKIEDAIAQYRLSIQINDRLAEQHPNAINVWSTASQSNLAELLHTVGRDEDAMSECESALNQQKKIAEKNPTDPQSLMDLASCQNLHGILLESSGRTDLAIEELKSAKLVREKLYQQFPENVEYKRLYAESCNNLGELYTRTDRMEDGLKEQKISIEIRIQVASQFPSVPEYQTELVDSQLNLIDLLGATGKMEDALNESLNAKEVAQALVSRFPKTPEYMQLLSQAQNILGMVLDHSQRGPEARIEYAEARKLQEKLVADFPDVQEYALDLGGSYCNFGLLICREGEPDKSLEWFDLAIKTLSSLKEVEPQVKKFIRNSYQGRANAYSELLRFDDSIRDWDQVVSISSAEELPQALLARATGKIKAGYFAEGISDVDQLLEKSTNWEVSEWYAIASAYSLASSKIPDKKLAFEEKAVRLLRIAVKEGWTDVRQMKNDTDLDSIRERDDFKKLISELGG